MNCSMQTMLKVATGLGIAALIGYFVFPDFRAWLIAALPTLLLLLCPLSMIFCMRGMGTKQNKCDDKSQPQVNERGGITKSEP